MKNNTEISKPEIRSGEIASQSQQSLWAAFSNWWHQHLNPAEPPATANIFQREKTRRGSIASIIVSILLLSALALLPITFMNKSYMTIIGIFIGVGICVLALVLNRRGAIEIAGILVLALIYGAQAYIVATYPGGMTMGGISLIDYTIIPSVVVLAFFPVNSLFPITILDLIVAWALVTLTPHNATITNLLHTAPYQIFARVYILQIIVAIALYLWAHSSEQAIRRADQAEEVIRLEKREKERQQQELERMHQLDTGIQAILQTHVAVANGDLNARAPLNQEHMLWQVASALNNLIGRIQRLSTAENLPKTEPQSVNELNRQLQQKRDLPPQPKETQKIKAIPSPLSIIPPRMKRF
jgi:hypothetical protein